MKKNSIINSFSYAFKGIAWVLKERNFKIHVIAAILAIGLGLFLDISSMEWIGIILCIGGVMALESINTAIEVLVDKISPEFDITAGKIKDLSAGAVLLFSFAALAIGMIIFIPRLVNLL